MVRVLPTLPRFVAICNAYAYNQQSRARHLSNASTCMHTRICVRSCMHVCIAYNVGLCGTIHLKFYINRGQTTKLYAHLCICSTFLFLFARSTWGYRPTDQLMHNNVGRAVSNISNYFIHPRMCPVVDTIYTINLARLPGAQGTAWRAALHDLDWDSWGFPWTTAHKKMQFDVDSW